MSHVHFFPKDPIIGISLIPISAVAFKYKFPSKPATPAKTGFADIQLSNIKIINVYEPMVRGYKYLL